MLKEKNNGAGSAQGAADNTQNLAEPVSDLWRCSVCGANVKLHLRRRDPGNCSHCGARSLKPWYREDPRT